MKVERGRKEEKGEEWFADAGVLMLHFIAADGFAFLTN